MAPRRLGAALLLAVLLLAAAGAAPVPPSAAWLLEQVKTLSAAEMEGRASGTPGAERAARHIAALFERAGLPPGGDGGGYFQRFPIASRRHGGTDALAANVIGVLPGRDPERRHEAVVIGAHYDHLGRGAPGSPAAGAIHHGADDNASGTAVVLALARAFAEAGGAPRTLVFVAFAGEELGLLGSARYVEQPPVPLARTILMINLDMVGRLRAGRLHVGGVDSGHGLRALVEQAAGGLPLDLQLHGDPWTPSDHTSFYAAGVPVLFLFTGLHPDYHQPGDTWNKINAEGLATVAAFAARVTSAAVTAPPPLYVRLEPPARRPLFGIAPDLAADLSGVRVAGVRPASPAERAGVQPGDVIVRFGGADVRTLEDLTSALRDRRAGDRVEVVVRRDGREHTFFAVLAARR
ncbi:MAG TPA: M28 family peptidase [Candidatus Binatia bacterium]|nr:M28 family peptidase [Candidatus Binatia bacterium]